MLARMKMDPFPFAIDAAAPPQAKPLRSKPPRERFEPAALVIAALIAAIAAMTVAPAILAAMSGSVAG